MLPEEELSTCAVVGWWYGIGSNCKLKIEYNQKCFHITLSPNAANTIEGSLLQRLDNAQRTRNSNEGEDEDEITEEIADIVCEAGLLQFEQLAPPPNPQERLPSDLDSLLHPKTFYFQLVTVQGLAQIVRQPNQDPENRLTSLKTATSNLPLFAIVEIQVLQKLKGIRITKVLVNGQERCCKISIHLTQLAVQREFDYLSQVMAANVEPLMRVPKIVGLVHDHNGQIVGILEEFIRSPPGYSTLQRINSPNVTASQKAKWAEQVQRTVADLHRLGVVWGDGKADNVLLDENEDAWLIDFGGGWTPGWVEESVAGTIEGDMHAVEKIRKFLGVE